LTLRPGIIAALDLVWRRRGGAILADGSAIQFDVYEATVDWDGELRRIAVDEADTTPLVGMALMNGFELRIQIVDGGTAILESLP
jgi:predicted aspartyl protease